MILFFFHFFATFSIKDPGEIISTYDSKQTEEENQCCSCDKFYISIMKVTGKKKGLPKDCQSKVTTQQPILNKL